MSHSRICTWCSEFPGGKKKVQLNLEGVTEKRGLAHKLVVVVVFIPITAVCP